MKIRYWYFQGWEKKEGGKGNFDLVYTGEYYHLPEGFKAPALCMTAALLVLYITAAFFPSAGGMWRVSAGPQLIEAVPLIYLLMGAVNLLRGKGPLTFRDWYTSWRRMKLSSLFSLILTALMAAVEIVYIFLYRETASLPSELIFLLKGLACAALSAALHFFIRKRPCAKTENKK